MTTSTVKHTPADAAPIELAGMFLEWQRIEDAKAELAEQSKDLFKVAKDKGYDTKAMRAVFREKRIELEASPEDAAKAEEAEAMNDLYRSALDRGLTARARPAHDAREIIEEFPLTSQPYYEVKGRERPVDLQDETGEITDNQDQIGGNGTDLPVEAPTDKQAAGASRPTNSNSPDTLPVEANSAGEAPSSSPASPATHSDDIDLTIPDFLRRTEGGYPKRDTVEA